MANIQKRKGKHGTTYRVLIRLKGHKTISRTFDRHSEAVRWSEEVEDALRAGVDLDGVRFDDLRFDHALDRYLVELSSQKAPNTRAREESAAKNLLAYFAPYTLKEITPAMVAAYRDERQRTVGASTIHKELALISHLYRVALQEWSLVVVNPVAAIRKPTLPRGRLRLLTKEEADRLLIEAGKSKNKKLYSYILLQLYTGMRPSEGAGLRWDQVLLSENIIDLTKTKTDPRRVPLASAAVETLASLEQKGEWVFLENPSRNIIIRPNLYFKRSFTNAVTRAVIEDFHMHDLRHTAASYLIMAGVDVRTLADILGHKTMDMVKRYTHLLDDHKIAAVGKIDGYFNKKGDS